MALTSIAFIPDGNRRYVNKLGLPIEVAHHIGTQKAWEVLDWLVKYKSVKAGIFWAMSLENFNERNSVERKILFKILEHELGKVATKPIFAENEIALKFMGNLQILPQSLLQKIKEAEEATENFKKRTVYLALAYSGRDEIVSAAKKIAKDFVEKKLDLDKLNEESFKDYLYADYPEPDLIVRTGGMPRLSSFLAYQGGYSELYFSQKLWPEFSEKDLAEAISHFENLPRNFGK